MMEQPPLFNTMSRLVTEQCGAILAEARRQAGAELDQARADRARLFESRLALARREAAERVRANRERATAEAERHALLIQEMVVDELLDKVAEALTQMATRQEFGPILDALLREALEDASCARRPNGSGSSPNAPGGLVVTVPDTHRVRCEQLLNQMGLFGVEVRPDVKLLDGVAVEDRAHTFRIVNTLASRYERIRDEARALCLARLFHERTERGA